MLPLFHIISVISVSQGNRITPRVVLSRKRDDLRPGKVCRLGSVQLSQLPVDLGANA